VTADGQAMTIMQLSGALTRSLAGLTVTSGAGLGGKSLLLGRPTRVRDYLAAEGITHLYDHAVEQEHLRTVAAMPVRVGNTPRYVVYLGSRRALELGDRWLDALAPRLGELEREIAVQEELRRRLRQLAAPTPGDPSAPSAHELREIAGELADLAETAPKQPWVRLTPRETAVLEQVAAGCSNADVAERLGLLPNTVKSYLKSAMRKLGVNNRVQAIVAARKAGAIR
jgi:DNA-binding CsgD family transcriptional regulator